MEKNLNKIEKLSKNTRILLLRVPPLKHGVYTPVNVPDFCVLKAVGDTRSAQEMVARNLN